MRVADEKRMKENLGTLAQIRTGYPFRGRIERVEDGNCPLVQMGDVQANVGVVADVQARVSLPDGAGKHELHYGDVLFVARGTRNVAATFAGTADNTIATPHLFVLTPRDSVEFGDYLTWYLNLPDTQAEIRAMRTGSAVQFIPMSRLAQLKIPVPSVAVQQSIVRLQEGILHEQCLLEQIGELRRVLIEGKMLEAVRRGQTNE